MAENISRREILVRAAPAAAALSGISGLALGASGGSEVASAGWMAGAYRDGAYVLPPLAYGYDALEPHVDKETMSLHHDRHHKGYVEGLNKALRELAAMRAAGGEINVSALAGLQEDLSFNGSGHVLHSIFWSTMSPKGGGEPGGALAEALAAAFGSVAAFRAHFGKAAAGVKGSGWAVLAYEPVSGGLIVQQVKQHDLQTVAGAVPLLPLDVWEHAYYLKYRNVRGDYVKAWWDVVSWPAVEALYASARATRG